MALVSGAFCGLRMLIDRSWQDPVTLRESFRTTDTTALAFKLAWYVFLGSSAVVLIGLLVYALGLVVG